MIISEKPIVVNTNVIKISTFIVVREYVPEGCEALSPGLVLVVHRYSYSPS
jgi:hypothetical protein